ncbi:MAG: hypothetical protein HY089_11075 [Ignavibacteriales bacterium]|nr:hypothetical protein [Ignavibacteriales bacterium]
MTEENIGRDDEKHTDDDNAGEKRSGQIQKNSNRLLFVLTRTRKRNTDRQRCSSLQKAAFARSEDIVSSIRA